MTDDGGRYRERAGIGGTEYDDGMTSSIRQASRPGEEHDAPVEAPRRRGRENRGGMSKAD